MIDYHDFTRPSTPKARRKELDVGDIYINQWRCNLCGSEPRSRHRRDVATCDCLAISVDGGSWYTKLSGDINNATSMVVYYDDAKQQ